MANQATAATPGTEPIDRLEEKIKLLVNVVIELRAEQEQAQAERTRLTDEIAALRQRLAEADGASGEIDALRQERDVIRGRVGDMLAQLEGLHV